NMPATGPAANMRARFPRATCICSACPIRLPCMWSWQISKTNMTASASCPRPTGRRWPTGSTKDWNGVDRLPGRRLTRVQEVATPHLRDIEAAGDLKGSVPMHNAGIFRGDEGTGIEIRQVDDIERAPLTGFNQGERIAGVPAHHPHGRPRIKMAIRPVGLRH